MKIYLDYVFFINLLFDFILLLGISILLKRNVSKKRLFFGSIIGGLSGFLILLPISSYLFFVLKILFGLTIVVITFSYKSISYTLNNFFYLIILSILLGGSLYFINIEVSKTVFRDLPSSKIYVLLLVIFGFVIIILSSKYILKTKKVLRNKYKVLFFLNNKKMSLIGYLDTGNNLMHKNRPVLILNKNIDINLNSYKVFYIPFTTVSGSGLMKCIKIDYIEIEKKKYNDIYLAFANDKFYLKNADIILNVNLWEEDNE